MNILRCEVFIVLQSLLRLKVIEGCPTKTTKSLSHLKRASLAICSAFLFLLVTDTAQAAVTILNSWANKINNTSVSPQSFTYTTSSGTNRLLVVAITTKYGSTGTRTYSASYGGKSLTLIAQYNTGRDNTWVGYLKEADIASRSGDTIQATYSGSPSNIKVFVASYQNVDQSSPITDANGNGSITTSSSVSFGKNITIAGGDQLFYVAHSGSSTASHTPPSGYSELLQHTGNGFGVSVGHRNSTLAGSENQTIRFTVSSLVSLVAASLNEAATTCTVSAPTVSITPTTQTISTNGGSAAYTVTVKNNDSGSGCTNTTFNLALMDTDSTGANFVTPSVLGQTSLTMAPGANTNVTMTVRAKTGATAGTNSTSVTATATGHTSSTSNAVITNITLPDTTPPTVTAFTMSATAATLTVPVTTLTATDNVGVTGYLVNESSTVPSATATGWTTAAPASYTFTTAGAKTLYAWAKDAAGNVSANKSATVTVTLPASITIWPSSKVPTLVDAGADSAVELGVKFRSDTAGYITGIRFYKASANTGTHVGNLWSSTGTRLATATFTNETTSGWQQVNFSSPVAITANTVYVASYHCPVGHYSDDLNFFTTAGVDNAPLHALAEGVSGVNGVYSYGSTSSFPSNGWRSSNYWVDVAFSIQVTTDTTPPTITSFTVPSTSTTLTVAISAFTANDNIAVTGYLVNETATAPLAGDSGWTTAAPTSYTFATVGAKTLYAWVKDAAGNVSASKSATVTITDITAPTVNTFTIPATANSLTVAISAFTANDNIAVTGYLVNETATAPLAGDSGWTTAAPTSYTFATVGAKTLYAWVKDAAGNVSASKSATVTITDITAPTVNTFTIPATANSLTVAISAFTANDNIAVTGYLVNETATAPLAGDSGWTTAAPTSYTFATVGAKTLYAWVKDAAGNVSASKSATVTITVSTPEPSGWHAGDMHVHRSCGGSPIAISTIHDMMVPNNLAFVSLLADMGNGEVKDPAIDLPRVNGQDDPTSTLGRVVHWDAEWHWDPIYTQYPHHALGGHIVSLGLTEAHQILEEYTYPIFNWAHTQNGIAGFAHLEYLGDGFPQNLDCCTPVEYPVETALGSSDFISEDVVEMGSTWPGLNPENAIKAYYRLLNNGFRPSFAAGTDYPCTDGSPLGSLLTYVQIQSGDTTYRNWINGIAKGRTVVSRNGHNEFINLTVNNTAGPGDEIKLAGSDTVQVAIQWTATQNLTGTIELVKNGVVVSSQQAIVASGAPVTFNTTADFTKSGWLAARRMDSNGHVVHTAAVFVIVDNAPVRASAEDAQFYVQWMDSLLANTSTGGAWNSYFTNNLNEAQARYQAARALYQQIALEAAGTSTATLVSIAVTPSNQAILIGGTQQFTATGTYSDGSTLNLTGQATWSSSDSNIASIGKNGLVLGVSSGSVVISAKLGDITGTANLTSQVPPPIITTQSLASGVQSIFYSATLTASAGTSPYTWSIINGSLPDGLSLGLNSGVISGTPTTSGSFGFTVQATDSGNPVQSATKTLSISVAPPSPGNNPILIISSTSNPFSSYNAEILRAEGFNSFDLLDIIDLSPTVLNYYDVVILGETALTSAQVTMLTGWVNAGGHLVAMRPDKKLAGLLGLTDNGSTLSNAYLLVDTSSGPGMGISQPDYPVPRRSRPLHG